MAKIVHRPLGRKISDEGGLYTGAGQRKYLTEAERSRFIAAANTAAPAVKTLCLTLAYCGCRLSEALSLMRGDIEPEGGFVAIFSLKKRGKVEVRQVPASPAFLALLVEVHHLRPEIDEYADRRLWPWHRTRAWQLVKAVMIMAGLTRKPASPRGLRHTFGVHAVLTGVPLPLIQKWLGHADISTTAIYTNVLGREEKEIAARMW